MAPVSERKLTLYLPADMQMKLITTAQKNKLTNMKKGLKGEYKLSDSMGSLVREAVVEYMAKKKK